MRKRGFAALPLQTRWVRKELNLSEADLLREMRLLKPDGTSVGGTDALLELARYFWWAWPLVALSYLPGGARLLASAYRWVAGHRDCVRGTCTVSRTVPLLPIVCLAIPITSVLMARHLPGWAFMWLMAASLWLSLKLLTVFDYGRSAGKLSPSRLVGYLLAWPGMDAREFFTNQVNPQKPSACFVLGGLLAIGGGLFLLLHASPMAAISPLLGGWIAMIGGVLTLHFGIFKLLAGIWQRAGIPVTPLMNSPLKAKSLAEFWGRRWNTGFSIPARRLLIEPLAPKIGAPAATLLVFVVSGLLHELVISLPARAGYGLPTLYFLVQGLAVLFERSKLGRKIGLGQALRGRCFMFLITAGPVFWLFHPPFVKNVILPLLETINTMKGAVL